jgi:AcrR family transcriptional regulator
VSAQPSARLPAPERRQALVDIAMRLFAARGYHGVTTAEIAREAGVSEPILYRHFASKRDLYRACLESSQRQLREAVERAIAETPDPADWIEALARTAIAFHRRGVVPPALWMQAVNEAGEETELRSDVRKQMREAHALVAGIIRRGQERGGIARDRDPDAEAWTFLGIGMVVTFARRLGGVMKEEDMTAIASSRSRWLTSRG